MDKFLREEENKSISRDEKVSRRRRFVRVVRAVLFHIKLRRRNRESRIGGDSMRSSSNFSFRFKKGNNDFDSKIDLTKSASMRSTSSSVLLSSSSSSRLSFQLSEPRTSVSSIKLNPKPPKQSSLETHGSLGNQNSSGSIIIGFVLILMSLALTILWGKVWAIVFNAIWLSSIPQSWTLSRQPEAGSDDVDKMESIGEQRRRVMMEGLVDRRHHHHRQSCQQQTLYSCSNKYVDSLRYR